MGERYLGGNDLISRHYRNITTLISHAMKQEITQKENKSKADLFVSVHCNSFSSAVANGVEVLYYPTSAKGQKAAQCVQDSLVKTTKLTNRGIKPRKDLHVLKSTVAPAILIECAFLSNPKEESMLKNQPEPFASAIFEGIREYCIENKK